MSVTSESNRVREAGNGSKTAFDFSFKIFAVTELEVYKVVRSTNVATLKVLTTDYTVSINSVTEGGTVTFVTAPTSLEDSLIVRVLPFTQGAVLPTEGNFREDQVEEQLDRAVMRDIQLQEQIDRCIQVGIAESSLTTEDLEDAVADAEAAASAAAASQGAAASSASAASSSASAAAASAASIPSFPIADSNLQQISTASKVHGSALTGLASIPGGAGVIPIANLASGTPTGSKFIRDDGTLAAAGGGISYVAGDTLLQSLDTSKNITQNTPTLAKFKEFTLPAGVSGTLRIKFDLTHSGVGNAAGRIYRNGVAVGTSQSVVNTTTTFSEDIAGWSAGDLVQFYGARTVAETGSVANFRIYGVWAGGTD